VPNRNSIQIELVKLGSDARLLRFTEPNSEFPLEQKLDPNRPVSDQKEALAKVFQAVFTRAQLAFA
jgi:hypothetical protein